MRSQTGGLAHFVHKTTLDSSSVGNQNKVYYVKDYFVRVFRYKLVDC